MKRNVIMGIILILIGGFFILKKYFGLEIELNWEKIWPILLVVWGISLIFRD